MKRKIAFECQFVYNKLSANKQLVTRRLLGMYQSRRCQIPEDNVVVTAMPTKIAEDKRY